MLKRIVENHQDEHFRGIENAREYAKEAEKSSKMRFRGFLNKLAILNIKGEYLEVGAGTGTLAAMIAKDNRKINITAIEMSPDMIAVGNEYIKKKKLESQVGFINGNIEDDKLLDKLGKFDLVYSTFSLHHWENPEKAIKNLMGYVKAEGVLVLYDLKRVWWLYWIPSQNGFFKSIRASYKPHEIKKMLSNLGVKKYEIKIVFPFFMQNVTIWK